MGLGLGISVYWATQSGPAAAIVSAFKSRVIADGGTVESPSCAKSDVKFLLDNPEPSAFDADYQAVLDRSTALGYTAPSAAQQTLQNTLVEDLKTAGAWDKLDALYIMANDGSSDFGRLNWASPSAFELSELNSPTFTSNEGFKGGGTATLDTNITLDTDTTHFSVANRGGSFGGWSYNVKIGGGPSLMGTDATIQTIRGGSNDRIMGWQAGSGVTISGLYHMNAKPDGTIDVLPQQYINGGLSVSGQIEPPVTYTADSIYLLSEGGTAQFSLDTISIAFIGGDLSAEASDLYNAFNTYMSAL